MLFLNFLSLLLLFGNFTSSISLVYNQIFISNMGNSQYRVLESEKNVRLCIDVG